MSDAPVTTIELGGRRVEVMSEPGGEPAMAAVIAAVATHDATCRRALAAALDDDDVALYVTHHLEHLPGLAAELGVIEAARPTDAEARAVLARLYLRTIWSLDGDHGDGFTVRFDYTLDARRTDNVLCVTLDRAGGVVGIAMES